MKQRVDVGSALSGNHAQQIEIQNQPTRWSKVVIALDRWRDSWIPGVGLVVKEEKTGTAVKT
jgi:hypothetical protein